MTSLATFTSVLGFRKAKHLLNRSCFHYSKDTLNHFATLTPTQAIDELSEDTTTFWEDPYDLSTNFTNGVIDGFWLNSGNPPSYYPYSQDRKRAIVSGWWWYNMIKQNKLKHKLIFFLHTCFTVAKDGGAGKSAYFYDYLRLLDFYAYGSIKVLAEKITFDNAMLYYLDNTTNNKNNPNENYAREFLELFTILKGPQIGIGNYTNYTEHDIQQAARVFSGIKVKPDRDNFDPDTGIPYGFVNNNQHDTGTKTFSEAFNYQTIQGGTNLQEVKNELSEFVGMVFSKTETAKAYCRKLYRFFVKSEWNQSVENSIITPLASQLISSNYDLSSVLKTLLKSEHFYDEDNTDSTNEIVGSIVKNPIQFISQIISVLNITIPNPEASVLNPPVTWSSEQENFYNFYYKFCHNTLFPGTGMNIFSPESVAGYPADFQGPDYDRTWFSSNTIVARYKTIESVILGKNRILGQLTGANGGTYYQNIRIQFNSLDFVSNNISNPFDPEILVTEIVELIFCESIIESRLDYFMQSLYDIDPSYWSSAWGQYIQGGNSTQVKIRLDALFTKLINAPEFQLM